MKVDWKVVLPLALVVCVMVLYFVRVKPIEGLSRGTPSLGFALRARDDKQSKGTKEWTWYAARYPPA